MQPQKTALIIANNQNGIKRFASQLINLGFDIFAAGPAADVIRDACLPFQLASNLTSIDPMQISLSLAFSEDVRMALISPDTPEGRRAVEATKVPFIDLLYHDIDPNEIINLPAASANGVIQGLSSVGTTLINLAIKGSRVVVCDPADQLRVVNWLKSNQENKAKFMQCLAAKAQFQIAKYALDQARFLSGGDLDGMLGQMHTSCNYGENPWQQPAASFTSSSGDPLALDQFHLLEGTSPSYNNIADIDRMLQTMTHVAPGLLVNSEEKCLPRLALGVKHGNACGLGVSSNQVAAVQKMVTGNPLSIFGGWVITNFLIGEPEAKALLYYASSDTRRLLDGIIAPGFSNSAIDMLKRKGGRCRLMTNTALLRLDSKNLDHSLRYRQVRGGFLRQPNYTYVPNLDSPEISIYGDLSKAFKRQMALAWAVGATSNSNTITLVKDSQLIGNGVGQQDRVECCHLALKRAVDAGHDPAGSVCYSDSFFPFTDAPELLLKAGVSAILTHSGSIRDKKIINTCQDIPLVMIPAQMGRGFFAH